MELADESDNRSATSTVATTASLSSRIASLVTDFEEKLREVNVSGIAEEDEEYYYDNTTSEEEEEVVEMSEQELLRELENMEPAFQVCSRLFMQAGSNPIPLKRLTWDHIDDFRRKGFVVIDNFVGREVGARLRAEALSLKRQGRLQEASRIGVDTDPGHLVDRSARGDFITWLHQGRGLGTAPTFASVLSAFQELQEDLGEVMSLRRRSSEVQLAVYPPSGAQYVRHRDAFPDDGSEDEQRRVTAILYANTAWVPSHGGRLRIWLPRTADLGSWPPGVGGGSDSRSREGDASSPRSEPGGDPQQAGGNPNFGSPRHGTAASAAGPSSRGAGGVVAAGVANGHAENGSGGGLGALQGSRLGGSGTGAAASGHVASAANGYTNGPALANGHANGYANGHIHPHGASNLHASGAAAATMHAGSSANGYANGFANLPANGHANGYANGHASGYANGQQPNGPSGSGSGPHVHFFGGGAMDSGGRFRSNPSSDTDHFSDKESVRSEKESSVRSEPLAAALMHHAWGPGSTTSSMMAEVGLDSICDGASSIDDGSVDGRGAQREWEPAGAEAIGAGLEYGTAEGGERVVDVAPLSGRLVVFLSGAIDHAVLPSYSDRVAVTLWCQ